MTTYLACLGTRPEIIKLAALHRVLAARGDRMVVLHTGQHEAMAQRLYQLFDMGPDRQIQLSRSSPRLAHLTAELLDQVDAHIAQAKPDVVLVQGDTSSALVGALAAFYQDLPVAHVEAGLRTGGRDPFPEEMNRELIGRLARWHFAPTEQARQNLLREGVDPANVFMVGNTVIDAALWTRDRLAEPETAGSPVLPTEVATFLERHNHHRLVLITAHRRENWGAPIRQIANAVGQLLQRHPDLVAIWPLHPNPQVRADVMAVFDELPAGPRARACLTEPLDYPALITLLARSHFALTDSGGIQEEASAFGCPVLITRDSTERQELVAAGGARLVGTATRHIVNEATHLLTHAAEHSAMRLKKSPFGDGQSAQRIAQVLAEAA